MKTLTKNDVSLYLFDDNEYIKFENDYIQIGYPAKFIISDCNASDTVLNENVMPPKDWIGNKFLFVNKKWVINPDYVEFVPPTPPAIPVEIINGTN